MSFSFGAAGTQEETLSSISKAEIYGNASGDLAKKFATELVEAEKMEDSDTQAVRFTISASGHSYDGPGSAQSLVNFQFAVSLVPKPVLSV